MMYDEQPSLKVVHAATMWNERRNSFDIAKALKITEPQALRLLEEARYHKLIPSRSRPVSVQ